MRRLLIILLVTLATPQLFAEQKKGAEIYCEAPSYNFGIVDRGKDDIYHTFVIENRGDEPLIIKRVERSCSCMKASLSKRPIAPGEKRELKVAYEVRKMPEGLFSKVVQIYSSSRGDSGFMQFTITGRSVNTKELIQQRRRLIDIDIEIDMK